MSQNKYMHPRNIYRAPPDFKQLAIDYASFRKICKMHINGTIQINFEDEKALCELTQCLLMRDFNLNVIFPSKHLIPALPLRLNYILWLEDIIDTIQLQNVKGIDIGCGSSCIYPILAAKKNDWNMIAIEIDGNSINFAKQNINQNNLENRITVVQAFDKDEPFNVLNSGELASLSADFTMCNPPFFQEDLSIYEKCDNNNARTDRSISYSSPKNAKSGTSSELATIGGEISFVTKMICDSVHLVDRIKVFTTMLGHRNSRDAIETVLKSKNITNYCWTEFCQGRTTRWGIAWTLNTNYLLRKVPVYGQFKASQSKQLTFIMKDAVDVETAHQKLCSIINSLEDIELTTDMLDIDNAVCSLVAYTNSWSNQRRKKKAKNSFSDVNTTDPMLNVQSVQIENELKHTAPLIKMSMKISKPPMDNCVDSSCILELDYLDGNAGINGVYQILQFISNKW